MVDWQPALARPPPRRPKPSPDQSGLFSYSIDRTVEANGFPWRFEDEATPWAEALLDRTQGGEKVLVPAHWPPEVLNALFTMTASQPQPLFRAL